MVRHKRRSINNHVRICSDDIDIPSADDLFLIPGLSFDDANLVVAASWPGPKFNVVCIYVSSKFLAMILIIGRYEFGCAMSRYPCGANALLRKSK